MSAAARLNNAREEKRDRKGRQKRWEMGRKERQFSGVEGETVKSVQWQRMALLARRAVDGNLRRESRRPTIRSICVPTRTTLLEEEYYISGAFGLRTPVHYIDGIADPIDLKAWSMTADGITLLLARVKQLRWQRKIIVGRARD